MPANKKRRLQDESDGEPQVTKKSKAKNEVSRGKDAEGNAYWGVGLLPNSARSPRIS